MAKSNPSSTVDFFQLQENARRATNRLVVRFALGIAGTAVLIHAILRAALAWGNSGSLTQRLADGYWSNARCDSSVLYQIDPVLFACVLAGTILFVGGVSFCKLLSFGSSTGADTAEALGGREVRCDAAETEAERRLVNVVQEMALASGVPVPRIFVLPKEKSINAFAAGMSAGTAAVAVSRGALEKLSRDELQGVVGHEFSHILNGDMRLNMRLVGWIFGLVAISTVGSIVMRLAHFAPAARGKNDKGAGAAVALILLCTGLALVVIGWLSTIFAQIIQASISRQRERLADASSAQFTRNPQALANALARIGGDESGSRLESPRAREFAHLFFASGVASLFATHPPLEERIRALNPQWDGKFLPPLTKREAYSQKENESESDGSGGSGAQRSPFPRRTTRRALSALAAVPAFVLDASKRTTDAKALIYLLMMTDSPAHNVAQARLLLEREDAAMFEKLKTDFASPQMRAFPPQKRIAAVLLAAPALRALDGRERAQFCETLELLAAADSEISIYEICILAAVRGLLSPETDANLSAAEIASELEIVLNLFLKICGMPPERLPEILASALAAQKGLPQNLRVRDLSATEFSAVRDAFAKLRCANILVRERAIAAARAIVAADGQETQQEHDLLNAFAVAVDCPTSA